MANVNPNGRFFTIAAANAFFLGNASDMAVGTYSIMLVSASFVGSITVKALTAAIEASTGNGGATETPLAINYAGLYVNGSTGTTNGLVTTAITGTSLIYVPASGLRIVLDCTAYTSGSMRVYAVPLAGAAA